jgi:uncharacterized protein
MTLKDRISEDMKAALGAHETERLGALRLVRAEILKAEKEKGQEADDAKVTALMQTMLKQRRDSISQFEAAGREDLAAIERAEMKVIAAYLPEPLGEDDINAAIDAVLSSQGAPDPKQLGKLMGQVMGKLKATGRPFDGQKVNERVRARLGLAS